MAVMSPPGPTLFVQADLEEVQTLSLLNGTACVFAHRAPGSEVVSEDAIALVPFDATSGVIVIADGAGGLPAGEEASRLVVESIRDAVDRARGDGENLRGAILNGIESASLAIRERGQGSASTVSAVEIQPGSIRPYHVGDSPILLTGQRGRIKFQAVAHSPVGYAVESGLLDATEAATHEERHIVSNFVGTSDMRIEVGPVVPIALRDTLVVASDGLSDNLFVEEIVACVRKGQLARATTELVRRCRRRMERAPSGNEPHHPDDLTIVTFRRNG